ncbi:unnamed protein product [Caenorhabditis angaria]|uniref:Uncharacterized protein n=1 Tax=Caenorhabditis angaria TaxID=860376 RepID=A0A9P1IUR8_9PELO|nr:unnamed protein product [Caenorhabditis angaria]
MDSMIFNSFNDSTLNICVLKCSLMMVITLQSFFSLDRLLFIKVPKFYNSIFYTVLFIGLCFMVVMISTAFAITQHYKIKAHWLSFYIFLIVFKLSSELIAMQSAREKYAQTTGLNLNQRFDLSISYEITRSFVFGTLFNILLQVFLAIFAVLIVFDIIHGSISILQLLDFIFILEFSVFPWIVLITNQRWRKKICCSRRSNKVYVMDLKGHCIVTNPTQKDYFDQLETYWNV